MTTDELLFFLKYMFKQWFEEIKGSFKAVTNLARPKLWMFVFSIILIFQIAVVRQRFEVLFTLAVIMFIWMWDYWEAGHWRGEMRRENFEKMKQKAKEEKDKQ
ncbi:hypothetical protein KY326_03850 [Candidatus Woesearchaeota archaeon]|nr:hypothetical protein [Candidatus Woesearchaeota archaeon]